METAEASDCTYEEVNASDLCGSGVFRRLKSVSSHEFDRTLEFYKKYPVDNPFIHISKTHNLLQCTNCWLVFITPRLMSGTQSPAWLRKNIVAQLVEQQQTRQFVNRGIAPDFTDAS
jgi:hypothetical protein